MAGIPFEDREDKMKIFRLMSREFRARGWCRISFSSIAVGFLFGFFLVPVLQAENSVRIQCPLMKEVVDGDSIPVKIYITNDVPLTAFGVVLH